MEKTAGELLRDISGWPTHIPALFQTAEGESYAIGKVGIGLFEGREYLIIKEAE